MHAKQTSRAKCYDPLDKTPIKLLTTHGSTSDMFSLSSSSINATKHLRQLLHNMPVHDCTRHQKTTATPPNNMYKGINRHAPDESRPTALIPICSLALKCITKHTEELQLPPNSACVCSTPSAHMQCLLVCKPGVAIDHASARHQGN
jgi:hypothetical protein